MNVWPVSWYTPVLIEGNKFWCYAICISIIRRLGALVVGLATNGKTQETPADTDQRSKAEGITPASEPIESTTSLLNQLVVDFCDLTLPVSFLGWLSIGNLGVGIAMVISTVLAWWKLWSCTVPDH